MKHRWTTLLWELWAAQTLCAVAALPPGSAFHTCPALALPGLALAAAVPTAWAAWALLAEPPDGLPPEQLLEQAPGFDFATLCDFERPAAVPEKRAKQKPLCREPGTEVLFVNQKAIKRSC